MKKLEYLNSLRGIAAILVLLVHAGYSFNQTAIEPIDRFWFQYLEQGQRGVQLFFIISAFTLYLSWEKRDTSDRSGLIAFYIRRFFRIAPAYYSVLLLFSLKLIFSESITTDLKYSIVSHFIFLNGLNPRWANDILFVEWSIGVEIVFYVLIPFLCSTVTSLNRSLWFFVLSAALSYLLSALILHYEADYKRYLDQTILTQLPVFAMGFIVYFLTKPCRQITTTISYPLLIISIMLLFSFNTGGSRFFPNHIVSGIAFSIMILSLSLNPIKLFVNSFFSYVGKISFSIYLIHFSVLSASAVVAVKNNFINSPLDFWWFLALNLALILFIATVMFKLVEEPGIRLGKYLIAKLS